MYPLKIIRSRAFSLVETSLAIAVAAFALTGLAGLMPVALESMRQARNAVVISELARAHLAEANWHDFSTLNALVGSRWYDYTGSVVSATSPAAYYCVRSRVDADDSGIARVQVGVYRHPVREGESRPLDEFIAFVANNGR